MLALITSKLGVYAAIGALCLALGFYAGTRWDASQIAACHTQIAQQAQADAAAAAAASAMAVRQMQEADVKVSVAETALQAAQTADVTSGQAITATIAKQAALPGRDGTVAPVLSAALAAIGAAK
ncbi:MAG: hypothetical protein POG24_08040 [Acidocella sp.]|nr:hypothetical protein [Acidocella sp.]